MSQPEVKAAYFSPTGATRTVIENISAGLGQSDPERINLSDVSERDNFFRSPDNFINSADFFIVGLPVYFGKIPRFLQAQLKNINGNGKPAVAVVVYGNRGFGIALKQLVSLLNQSNFKVIAAGAFIGEHSLSSKFPIALGRPDDYDISMAVKFGEEIYNKREALKEIEANDVPGKRDMLLRMTPEISPRPKVDLGKCNDCGICVETCPMGVIDAQTKLYKNKDAEKLCQGCMSCVKKCPQGARTVDLSPPLAYLTRTMFLNGALKSRKKPFTMLK
ncbi:MAG: 4Fe-4S binding protein [Dehalococcoidia bacterium]